VLDSDDPQDRATWLKLWEKWEDREVFAHPHYGKLFAGESDRFLCATYSPEEGGMVMYPFLIREVSATIRRRVSEHLTDITTPYGYGGPFVYGLGDHAAESSRAFWTALEVWMQRNNVVSEFIRFSVFDDALLPYPGEREFRSYNFVRSLDEDSEAIWTDYESKVRRNVRRARNCGVAVEIDHSGEHLEEFLRVYRGTMDRRAAAEWYYFPESFFDRIHRELGGQFAYFHARLDGEIVSSDLVLISARSLYYFLGGTDEAAYPCRPNDLIKAEITDWGKSIGKSAYVLGGGAVPGDGLERYKRAFAPRGVVEFSTGRRVFDPKLYESLTAARRRELARDGKPLPDGAAFFPAYRLP
jgi:hypothetical protein